MKLTLSLAEIKTIVAAHYRISGNFDLEISGQTSLAGTLFDRIRNEIGLFVSVQNKISAIKGLREIARSFGLKIGLAEAKWSVENWTDFLTFVQRENRFPVFVQNPDWSITMK